VKFALRLAEKVKGSEMEWGCWWGNVKARGLLAELDVDGLVILQGTLKGEAGRLWTASSGLG
jgi:hypothetical protein